MIEFEELMMKLETDNYHIIFLLKKNVRNDIIKKILEYSSIATPSTFDKWKAAIIAVKQGYKLTEGRQDYRIESRITLAYPK